MSNYAVQTLCRAGISESIARSVASKLLVRSYDAQQIIWAKGCKIESWQFIMSGLVSASVPTSSDQSVPIAIYGTNSWFGEQSIFNRMPSCFEYVCLSPTQVITIPTAVLWELFDVEPGFSKFIAKLATWRAQKTSEMLILMKLGNPCLRVVMGLAQFSEALACHSERPPTTGIDGGVELPISQTILGSLCGVSRTLVSENLHELEHNGWLSIRYGRIELLSTETWHRFSKLRRAQPTDNIHPMIDDLLDELHSASIM